MFRFYSAYSSHQVSTTNDCYYYYYYYHHHHHHHHLYAGIYAIFLRQTMSLGNTLLQLFCCCIHGAYTVSFSVESIVLLH